MPELSTFEHLATLQRGFDLPSQDRVQGDYPIVSSSGISGSHCEFRVEGPGVVTGRSGTIGLVHYSEGDFWPLNTTLFVKDFKGNLPKYVALVLEILNLKTYAAGSTVPSLNRNVLRNVPVWIPPLDEQQRIVDLIGTLDHAIDAAEEQVCTLRRLASSTRSKIFATLSESCPGTTAGEFFEVTLGRQKSARQLHGNHEIPYLRAANIIAGSLSLSDVQTMNFDPKEQIKYALRNGDVLVVEGGSVGQTAVWNNAIDGPVGFDKHVLRIRGLMEISTAAFANHWAQWCYESGRFEAEARGVTIKALGYQRAKDMAVPKASLAEQNETVEFLDAMDLAVQSSEETSASLRSLRSELLAALLSGAHTIPDSYDELMSERVA